MALERWVALGAQLIVQSAEVGGNVEYLAAGLALLQSGEARLVQPAFRDPTSIVQDAEVSGAVVAKTPSTNANPYVVTDFHVSHRVTSFRLCCGHHYMYVFKENDEEREEK
jgi:hypothetical protein